MLQLCSFWTKLSSQLMTCLSDVVVVEVAMYSIVNKIKINNKKQTKKRLPFRTNRLFLLKGNLFLKSIPMTLTYIPPNHTSDVTPLTSYK